MRRYSLPHVVFELRPIPPAIQPQPPPITVQSKCPKKILGLPRCHSSSRPFPLPLLVQPVNRVEKKSPLSPLCTPPPFSPLPPRQLGQVPAALIRTTSQPWWNYPKSPAGGAIALTILPLPQAQKSHGCLLRRRACYAGGGLLKPPVRTHAFGYASSHVPYPWPRFPIRSRCATLGCWQYDKVVVGHTCAFASPARAGQHNTIMDCRAREHAN